MQVGKYSERSLDFLFRREVERRVFQIVQQQSGDRQLFDCNEFGHCLFLFEGGAWVATWFERESQRRPNKPRIAVTVSITDTPGKERRRWKFAMSKLGFLYPVAFEQQKVEHGLWITQAMYYSWHRQRQITREVAQAAIPDDSVCREAERLYKNRKKKT